MIIEEIESPFLVNDKHIYKLTIRSKSLYQMAFVLDIPLYYLVNWTYLKKNKWVYDTDNLIITYDQNFYKKNDRVVANLNSNISLKTIIEERLKCFNQNDQTKIIKTHEILESPYFHDVGKNISCCYTMNESTYFRTFNACRTLIELNLKNDLIKGGFMINRYVDAINNNFNNSIIENSVFIANNNLLKKEYIYDNLPIDRDVYFDIKYNDYQIFFDFNDGKHYYFPMSMRDTWLYLNTDDILRDLKINVNSKTIPRIINIKPERFERFKNNLEKVFEIFLVK